VDPDVLELVRQERVLEAAELASERGHARDACALFERACDWRRAGEEALRAGDASRALDLAAQGDDGETARRAIDALAPTPALAEAAADRLARRAQHAWAARTLEAAGSLALAAAAWERAGDAIRSAALLDRLGDPMRAARLLETTLRRSSQSWAAAVALGSLLARFGKDEAAVRALQRVPTDAPERRDALVLLEGSFRRLGLEIAASTIAAERLSLGDELPLAPLAPPPVRARLFGRYEVVREIASSPTARVLECRDGVRGTTVAVKLFAVAGRGPSAAALASAEREIRALRHAGPPNVAPVHEFLADGPAVALRWMEGGTLDQLLAKGALAPSRAAEVAAAMLTALGEAHRLGILHRDVKPTNVLFDSAGTAHLSDFGTAHLSDTSATATAGVFGTLAYVSPEQREGRAASARGDIYAVGVVLREMLTGERPSAFSPPARRPSQSHRDLDARHDRLVAELTAARAEDRPPSALEARAQLLALPWPDSVEGLRDAAPDRKSSSRPAGPPHGSRLEPRADGRWLDTWTGRVVECVPLSDARLQRARAFARAEHPSLQPVLRVDRAEGVIWLAPATQIASTPQSEEAAARVAAALEALRSVDPGVAVDPAARLLDDDGSVVVAF
jgi:eukaryotic-like serine/threonine-protein kinase